MQFAGNTPSFLFLCFHQAHSFVGNPNFLCRLFLVMDVETTSHIPLKRSIRRVARHCPIKYPAVLPSVMPQAIFHLKWTTSIEAADVNLQAAIKVLWMHV